MRKIQLALSLFLTLLLSFSLHAVSLGGKYDSDTEQGFSDIRTDAHAAILPFYGVKPEIQRSDYADNEAKKGCRS